MLFMLLLLDRLTDRSDQGTAYKQRLVAPCGPTSGMLVAGAPSWWAFVTALGVHSIRGIRRNAQVEIFNTFGILFVINDFFLNDFFYLFFILFYEIKS